MKILIAIFFGVIINGFSTMDGVLEEIPTADAKVIQPVAVNTDNCTLTIAGYANFEGMRVKIMLSAEAETCEEAAGELREEIIEQEIRIAY